jgi:hypothetical protein
MKPRRVTSLADVPITEASACALRDEMLINQWAEYNIRLYE